MARWRFIRDELDAEHDEWLAEKLKDAAFAAEYLTAAAEDDDAATYLAALRKVAEASGAPANTEFCGKAEDRLQSKFSANMARAKQLDEQGNRSGCAKALNEAKRMYIPK